MSKPKIQVVLRTAAGDRIVRVAIGTEEIRVPVPMRGGFGLAVYRFDGKTDKDGRPIFR